MAGPIKPIASSAQIDLGFESEPEQLQRKKPADPGYKEVHEKYNPPEKDHKGKAAENKEFEDNRQQRSKLIQQAEMDKIKEILNKPKSGGAAVGATTDLMERKAKPFNKAKGGVISASSRADGIAQRGKTKGRIV